MKDSSRTANRDFLLGTLFCVSLGLSSLDAAVIHVDAGAAPGGDGSSWTTACSDLASALAIATTGDEIWVAAGTYPAPGAPFQVPDGVALYGGFAGNETQRNRRDIAANPTELDGLGTYRVIEIPDAAQANTLLDGFTIKSGYDYSTTTIGTTVFNQGRGAGVYSHSGSPTVRNCTFLDNRVNQNGGAIYMYDGSPILEKCTFTGNDALEDGGAGYLHSSSFSAIGCIFEGNSAGRDGAALYAHSVRSPTVVNCLFAGNAAGGSGGALYRYGSSISPGTALLANCTLAGNSANLGGALYDRRGECVVANCILHGNTSRTGPSVYNSPSGASTISYSLVEGGYPGAGNIAGLPGFAGAQDFHLTLASPCIDAGNNYAVPGGVLVDLDGKPRFLDTPSWYDSGLGTPPIVDMGAYEFVECSWPSFAYGTGCPGSGAFVPGLSGEPCAVAGQSYGFQLFDSMGGSLALVFFGMVSANYPITPSCSFLFAPILPPFFSVPLSGSGPGNGTSSLSVRIPFGIASGLGLAVQYFTLDPGAPIGLAASNGWYVTFL